MLKLYKHLLEETTLQLKSAQSTLDPVWIGGVGGSGTRVIAQILLQLGYSSGHFTTEKSLDNLFWPPFKQLLLSPAAKLNSREVICSNAIAEFEQFMNDSAAVIASPKNTWFSKVPVCFLMLPELSQYFPEMKYVHLMRNGLDMAFSDNVLQARDWAFYFGVVPDPMKHQGHGYSRADLLEYWIRANDYAVARGNECLGDRFLLLSFEALCEDPETQLVRLLRFIEEPIDNDTVATLKSLIRRPASINRYKNHDFKSLFTPQQLEAVRKYGYEIEG